MRRHIEPCETGKVSTLSLNLAKIQSQQKIASVATLLDDGRTKHSEFKLSLGIYNKTNSSGYIKNRGITAVLKRSSVITCDECKMVHKYSLKETINSYSILSYYPSA